MTQAIDAARLTLILTDLRLPAIKQGWAAFALRHARRQGELARRALPRSSPSKRSPSVIAAGSSVTSPTPGFCRERPWTPSTFDATPMIPKAHVMALCAGDSWIDKGANLTLIGGPGAGRSHLASAIGLAPVENGWKVLFARTSDLVQKLQVARRELALEAAIARLDRFHLLILDENGLHLQKSG